MRELSARHCGCLGARGRKLKHVGMPWVGESKLGREESEGGRARGRRAWGAVDETGDCC